MVGPAAMLALWVFGRLRQLTGAQGLRRASLESKESQASPVPGLSAGRKAQGEWARRAFGVAWLGSVRRGAELAAADVVWAGRGAGAGRTVMIGQVPGHGRRAAGGREGELEVASSSWPRVVWQTVEPLQERGEIAHCGRLKGRSGEVADLAFGSIVELSPGK